MTTIKKLVYRVWGMLDGDIESSSESRFTYREIREAVVSGVAGAIRQRKLEDAQNPEADKYGNDFESKTYEDLPVTFNEKLKIKTVELPAEMVATHDGRQVSVFTDVEYSFKRSQTFIPITKRELFLMKMQPHWPDGMVMFCPDGKRLLLLGTFDNETLNTTLKGSIPLDDDEEITAPTDFMNMVCKGAYEILAPQVKPTDTSIDGTPNP